MVFVYSGRESLGRYGIVLITHDTGVTTNCIHILFELAVMSVVTLNDPRVKYQTATLNGVEYNYILAEPASGNVVDTIFLIHGWPDMSLGWRNQIPYLLSKGLRVVAPDMMGYGGTDAPEDDSF